MEVYWKMVHGALHFMQWKLSLSLDVLVYKSVVLLAALDLRQDWDIPRWWAVVWQCQHPARALLEPQVVHNEE